MADVSIKNQALGGLKWTTISAIFSTSSSIVRISLLTRLLETSDFGLMALVLFVLSFATLFSDLGLSAAIFHKQNTTKNEYASLYWFSIFLSLVLFGIIVLIAPFISLLYEENELIKLISIMGFSLVITAIGKQFQIREQKKLNFKLLAIIEFLSATLSLICAISFAKAGFGVFSLVYSALIGAAFGSLSFLIIGLKNDDFKFHFFYKDVIPFLKIGFYNTGGQILNYFNKEVDILIVGRFFSLETLGMYSLAKQLVYRPVGIINPILTKVSVPVFAKIQVDRNYLKKSYLELINIISSINLPIYLMIILLADPIVRVLYGSNYEDIVPVVRILSIYMIFIMWRNPMGTITIASGRTDLEFYWSFCTFLILPLAVYAAAQLNIEMVATSMIIAMAILFVPLWAFVIRKIIDVGLLDYMRAHIPQYRWLFEFLNNKK